MWNKLVTVAIDLDEDRILKAYRNLNYTSPLALFSGFIYLKPIYFGEPGQVTTRSVNVFTKQQVKQCTLKQSLVFIAQCDKVQNIFVHRRFLIRTSLTYSRDIFMIKKYWLFKRNQVFPHKGINIVRERLNELNWIETSLRSKL